MKRKFFTIVCIAVLMCTVLGVSAYAEGTVDTTAPTPAYTITFEYTSDSTASVGISYETYSDALLNESGFKILEELPFGHVIYDDPDTSYIDGIRVNGSTVNSLKIAVKDDTVTNYHIVVRTTYAEGVLGDIAKMSDKTYDWAQLLENPIVLLQLVYWILAIISVIAGAAIASTSKKSKAKTSNEIADSVTEAAHNSLTEIKTDVTETVIREFTPVLTKILTAAEDVIKAVALSTSKSKEAPVALLDLLQQSTTSADVSTLIDDIREAVVEQNAASAAERIANVEILRTIGERASVPEEASEENAPEPKSVF